ncbi:hypothetical protein LguiA_002041 [Lonicera macranthoides]
MKYFQSNVYDGGLLHSLSIGFRLDAPSTNIISEGRLFTVFKSNGCTRLRTIDARNINVNFQVTPYMNNHKKFIFAI